MDNSQDWATVAAAIKSRRELLGLSQIQAAKDAGIGEETWRNIELNRPAGLRRGTTIMKIEKVLEWKEGTIEFLASGSVDNSSNLVDEARITMIEDRLSKLEKRTEHLISLFKKLGDESDPE